MLALKLEYDTHACRDTANKGDGTKSAIQASRVTGRRVAGTVALVAVECSVSHLNNSNSKHNGRR